MTTRSLTVYNYSGLDLVVQIGSDTDAVKDIPCGGGRTPTTFTYDPSSVSAITVEYAGYKVDNTKYQISSYVGDLSKLGSSVKYVIVGLVKPGASSTAPVAPKVFSPRDGSVIYLGCTDDGTFLAGRQAVAYNMRDTTVYTSTNTVVVPLSNNLSSAMITGYDRDLTSLFAKAKKLFLGSDGSSGGDSMSTWHWVFMVLMILTIVVLVVAIGGGYVYHKKSMGSA